MRVISYIVYFRRRVVQEGVGGTGTSQMAALFMYTLDTIVPRSMAKAMAFRTSVFCSMELLW